MYALVKDGVLQKYPYTLTDMHWDNLNVSFGATPSEATLETFGTFVVYFNPQPEVPVGQVVEEGTPVFDPASQRWEQVWVVRAKNPEEIAALQASIVAQTQTRLDAFAQTRNYDNILSACTYATSSVPKFAAEGQCAVNARDLTWQALYGVMADVQAGVRPMPTGFADVEMLLPALTWV